MLEVLQMTNCIHDKPNCLLKTSLSSSYYHSLSPFNTLRPRQNGRHFPDETFKRIFLNENVWISIEISLKFVPRGPINNIPALVQIMAWRRPGDKPLSGPMMFRLLMHICVTRPQWVNNLTQTALISLHILVNSLLLMQSISDINCLYFSSLLFYSFLIAFEK